MSSFCFVFLFFLGTSLAAYRVTDILVVNGSTFYDSAGNNFRVALDALFFWQTDSSGSWVSATVPPGAGDDINADFSSASCRSSPTRVAMSAVIVNATVSPSYGKISVISTRKCRSVLRVELGKTLVCNELNIGSDVLLMLEGTIRCNRFVLQQGALIMGKGSIHATTAQIDGDVLPGVLFYQPVYYVGGCNDCMASLLLTTFSENFAADVDTSYGQIITINTTALANVTGTLWIQYDWTNSTRSNKVRFTNVQFTAPARVRLLQAAGNLTYDVVGILVDNLMQPSPLQTVLSPYVVGSSLPGYYSPFMQACYNIYNSLSCVLITRSGSCTSNDPCSKTSDTGGCASASQSGTISLLLNTQSSTSSCTNLLAAVGTSLLVSSTTTTTTAATGPGGGQSTSTDVNGTTTAPTTTTATQGEGMPRSTVIVLATVIPISVVAVAVAVGLIVFLRQRELAKKRALFNAKMAAAAERPSPVFGV